jgi:hypothetical protein
MMSSIYISNRGVFTKKTVVHTCMVYYILHAEIKIQGFYKISKYKIFELFKNIDMNTEYIVKIYYININGL